VEKPKRSRRKQYAKEFKVEAVRLLEHGEKSPTELALELGVERGQLYRWKRTLRAKGMERAFRGAGALPMDERSEIERLKHELEKVKQERDILKKAAAYFAKDLP
jgi:transposase